jgi:hypothetical protein
MMNESKKIRLTYHANEQSKERGASEDEIVIAIRNAEWKPAKKGNRMECKYAFQFNAIWSGNYYAVKEVRPIFVEEETEIVVVTVYTYYN